MRSRLIASRFFLCLAITSAAFFAPSTDAQSNATLKEECPFSADRFIVELQQDDAGRRWGAAECLGKLKDPRAVEPLIQAIFKESIPRLSLVETGALKEIGDRRAEDILLHGLGNKGTKVQSIEALGRLKSKPAVTPLLALLQDPDRSVSEAAADSLAEIGDSRALLPLCERLRHRDEVVRRGAALDLGFFGDAGAVGALTDALKDPDDAVRENSADALGKLGSSDAVEALIGALRDRYEGVRVNAADSLGSIGDIRAVRPLITALSERDSRARWHAASALAKFDTSAAHEALDNALQHAELDVVAAGYPYFLKTKDPETIAALIAALNEHGWYEMVDAFKNSGDSRLVDAATQWEQRHDLEISLEQ